MKTLEKNLKYANHKSIYFDKNNPRGEKEHQILCDQEFDKLKQSIQKYGILEPIIVKYKNKENKLYTLIDGERRLRAAKLINDSKESIPMLIAKNDIDGRILAYQVHMLRKQWGKVSETKSIKNIILDIRNSKPSISETELGKELRRITAHKPHEIKDILRLCNYSDEIMQKVTLKELDMSYLVQIESSFISPISRLYPKIISKYGLSNLRQILAERALSGLFISSRYLMDTYKYVFRDKTNIGKIYSMLDEFISNKKKSIAESFSEYTKINPRINKSLGITGIKKSKKQKRDKVNKKDKDYKKLKLTGGQQTRIEDIRKRFEKMGKLLSKEEFDYVSEAMDSFENNCLKASIVMIWAAGISRVINFISKHQADYVSISTIMNTINKDPYRILRNKYKLNITSEDDLRDGKDWQLLFYLLYKKIISKTEYNKLKNCYNTRNDCAHPTDIKLNPNEVISIHDNIYSLIFNNKIIK